MSAIIAVALKCSWKLVWTLQLVTKVCLPLMHQPCNCSWELVFPVPMEGRILVVSLLKWSLKGVSGRALTCSQLGHKKYFSDWVSWCLKRWSGDDWWFLVTKKKNCAFKFPTEFFTSKVQQHVLDKNLNIYKETYVKIHACNEICAEKELIPDNLADHIADFEGERRF